jgi:sugar phosphate permease
MTNRIHWAWIILIASYLSIFTTISVRFSYNILMPEMIASLKITKIQAGGISSSFYLVYAIFSPFLGFLVDRVSARKLFILSSVIMGTGTFLMGKSVSFLQACFFFAIVALGSSGMWTPVLTLVQRWFGVRRRGMVLGILSTGFAIGYGIMGLILPPLVAQFGWRTCWFILSVPAFALVLINGCLIRTKPQDLNLRPWGEGPFSPIGTPSQTSIGGLCYGDLLKTCNLWLVAISYFFIAFTAYVLNIFIVTYGNMELRFPYDQAAKLASAIAFSGALGALLIPFISDFLGRKRCLILIDVSLSASIILIISAGSNWDVLLIAVCIFGFFYASVWPMYAAAAADFFPREVTGSVLGFWTIFYGLGVMLAGILGGYIADLTGSFTRSFIAAAFAGALGASFISPMKNVVPTHEKRKN